jgi:hypothetical protein
MVKVSTLIHRVDGFNDYESFNTRELPEQQIETRFLNELLEPLQFDPGDDLVQRLLQKL